MITQTLLPQSKAAKTIHNMTWEQLEELDCSLEDFAGVKLVYLDGTAEIMPIGREHEDFKSIIVRLLEAYMDEVSIPTTTNTTRCKSSVKLCDRSCVNAYHTQIN